MIFTRTQAASTVTHRPRQAWRWLPAYGVAFELLTAIGCAVTHDASTATEAMRYAAVETLSPAVETTAQCLPIATPSELPAPTLPPIRLPANAGNVSPGTATPLYIAPSPAINDIGTLHVTSVAPEPLPLSFQDASESIDAFGPIGESPGPDGEPSGPGGPGGPGDSPGYGITWYPSAAVAGQGTDLAIVRQSLDVDVPLWFRDGDAAMVSVGVDETHFSGQATLPGSLRPFPSDLWIIDVGLKHMHEFANGWSSMLMVDVGSPSDKPFHSTRELSYQVGGFMQIPAKNGRDSWTVGAIYSPSGSPAIPIPILSYNWHPSETFYMNIGLPFEMTWEPTEQLSFNLSYTPLLDVDALATYKFTDQLRVYGGYQYATDSYFLADREERKDQFFSIEQRLVIGIHQDLGEHFAIDLNTGYAFDRHFGEGDDQLDLSDRVDLESGAFLGGRLSYNF
jgi:hypothetical protein